MEKAINGILDIDKKAKIIIDRTNEQKQMLQNKSEQDLILMEKEVANENSTKLKEFQSSIDRELKEEERILIEKCNKQLKELDDLYSSHREDIVNAVLDDILQT